MQTRQLTDILMTDYGLSAQAIAEAQHVRRESGGSLGEVLAGKRLITEEQLLQAYARIFDLPVKSQLPFTRLDTGFTQMVPIQFLKKYLMVPIRAANGESSPQEEPKEIADPYMIAVNDPLCLQPLDDLVRLLDARRYELVLAPKEAILAVINACYDLGRDSAQQLVQDMEENVSGLINEIDETADLLDDTSDAPIIKLVNHIISQAAKERASDIHIETHQNLFKVRCRVDGILYDMLTPPKRIQPALISRIKVMANLNIAEKRLPQDGRFDVKVGNQVIDLRVSTIPTSFGERVVLRLLNKSGRLLELSEIGIPADKYENVRELIRNPNGILLVTGPTGSGKTTTLYAMLSNINKPDINIITIEDPVEYQIEGISQIQVNRKIDLTFARGLRHIVRQDPDVILIGEIRDLETAEIAVQSALTGHLVFSTLHTNDSASAITRLVDLGIEPFLISSSVIAVMAQRLVRMLCDTCKAAYAPDSQVLSSLGIAVPDPSEEDLRIFRAQGCENCLNTGYRGRIGIYELLMLDNRLKSLVLRTYDSNLIKKEALKAGAMSLRDDGIQKVLKGITTVEEVLRVTQK